MTDRTSNLETLDRAIEYYAEHAKGLGGTSWMNPATVLETLALLRELKQARPAAQSWENYATAQEREPTSGETTQKPADLSYDEFWQKVRETGWNPNPNDLRALLILWESEGGSSPKTSGKPECPVCFTTWGGCEHTAKTPCKPLASTDDGASPSRPSPSSVECPKCRTQLAFEGDECGLCKEEA